jgi:ABC-type transport system substrate-binding protein
VAGVKAYKSSWEGVVNDAGFGIDDNIWTWLTLYNPADDTIDYSFKSDIIELNRVHSQWLWDSLALDRIYEGLMDYNPFNLDLSEYFLAESHELGTWDNPDTGEVATELNFTLRSDPQPLWHDGDPVTLEDVKFSFDFYCACGTGVCWFYPSVQDINSVDIVDGKVRVRFNLFSIWAPMWVGDLPILKQALWGNIKDATDKTWTDEGFDFGAIESYDPVVDDADENGVVDLKQDGTGAWIFDDYVLGSYVSYVANTNYYLSQAEVDAALERMFHGEGDVDYDGGVGTRDIGLLLRAFLTTPATGGTPGAWGAWNPAADLNGDDEVTLQDLTTAGRSFGKESG